MAQAGQRIIRYSRASCDRRLGPDLLVVMWCDSTNCVRRREIEQELGPGPQPRGAENWEWVQAVIRVIDRRTPGVSNFSIGKLLRDVFVFVNGSPVRRAINKIVAAELTGEPTVVVAHSLGTVVAYEVLREHAGNSVPRLVTVGSPLGIRAIRLRLATPLKMPAGVRNWQNAFDPRDVVALYPLDANNFGIKPPIRNYSYVNNHTDNRHGIDGYLDDAEVATQIAMGFDNKQ
jgi:pimeloyl-ACP methyl ester carboxylesterase